MPLFLKVTDSDLSRSGGTIFDYKGFGYMSETENPCLTCGACCSYYRASFYWSEADDTPGGTVPAELTETLTPYRLVMKGTNKANPRCIALEGIVGGQVNCSIYDKRSSVCREFSVAWEKGQPSERCDNARMAWGIPPLSPPYNLTPGKPKKAA
jgi:Fe-S-cluster containining protein